ncbi:hypothetical protein AB1Y20_019334 [Prymnesium parvum]|uniref:Centrosomal protein of 162 kDa n=1 Tax=Prymnesium parvum TaxID=97485 RepID=A0AB34JVL0_PRYPA
MSSSLASPRSVSRGLGPGGHASPRGGVFEPTPSPRQGSPRRDTPRGPSPVAARRGPGRPPLNPSSAMGGRSSTGRMMPSAQPISTKSPRDAEDMKSPKGGPSQPDEDTGPAGLTFMRTIVPEVHSLDQAQAAIRMLAAQADEARAEKAAIWEQARDDARAMSKVAKNIEGNQGVLSKVVATLEAQLASSRQEKEAIAEQLRSEKRTWERLHKDQERQMRELEKQRDAAKAEAAEASSIRKRAQEALEASRRTDSEVVRSLQAEKAAMARELKELKAGGAIGARGEAISELLSSVTSLQATLGGGSADDLGHQLRVAREARDEAEAKLDALRARMREQITALTEEKETALAELQVAKSGESLDLQRLRANLERAQTEIEEIRAASAQHKAELASERAAKDKLLVQARLDQAAAVSREREHAQQMSGKQVQLTALERELSALAGQLVAAQGELKQMREKAERDAAAALRERTAHLQAQQSLESDKSTLESQLQSAEQQRATLVEQVAQCAGDREFCYEVIRDLRNQLQLAKKNGDDEVRL